MFLIFLPMPEVEEEIGGMTNRDATAPTGKEHILFVDDEIALVELAKRMLRPLGYKVTASISSIEALELFGAEPNAFDMVITDYTMPDMTGIQLAYELLNLKPDLPIILATGFNEMVTKEQAEAFGIKKFILKPTLIKDMAGTIREVLNEAKLAYRGDLTL